MVAGAARSDLVQDLRGAVDRAIADGGTLEEFRREFDGIVAKRGWSYKGGRNWRTNVIYGTNLRTSYAVGRRRQMEAIAERRPYWRYRHSDASVDPRPEHQAWDGRVLRHDDPWWDTHYPPNGWGCNCYVEALNDRDLERLGAKVEETPRGASIDLRGIDRGWAYSPGEPHQRRMRRMMGMEYERLRKASEGVAEAASRHGLTEPERVAVWGYTESDRRYSGPNVNRDLRAAKPPDGVALDADYHAMSLTLDDALGKLPDYALPPKAVLRRGAELSDDQLALYQPKAVVTEVGFTSTRMEDGVSFGGNTQFTIKGSRGKVIRDLSAYPKEEEVLFRAGTRFEVVKRWEEGDTVHIVIGEVEDDA